MKPKSLRFPHLLAAAITSVLALSSSAWAGTLYWDGGTSDIGTDGDGVSAGGLGTWNTILKNWDAGAVPHVAWSSATPDSAVFGGTADTVTLGEVITASGLTFNTGGYTIAESTLTFGGATPTIALGANNAAINSALNTGGLNVVKSGSGTLTLGSTSAMAGGGSIQVTGGQLRTGASLNLGTTQIVIDANQQLVASINNGITGGSIKLGAGSQFGIQNGQNGSNNTIASNIVLNSGTGSANAAQIGGFIYGNNTRITGTISGSGDLRWRNNILGGGSNSATLSAANNTSGWAVNSYTGATSFEGTNLTFALASNASDVFIRPFGVGAVTQTGGQIRILTTGNANNTSKIANAISFVASNGETTQFYREDGNLRLTGNIDIATTGTGKVLLTSKWGYANTKGLFLDGVLSGSGNLTISRTDNEQGSIQLTNNNTYNGTITVDSTSGAAGILVLGANGAATNAKINLVSSGAHLNVNTTNATIASLTGMAGSQVSARTAGQTLTVNQATNTTFAGVIGGTGITGANSGLNLVKDGAGTLLLAGANTYVGNTTVNNGVLDLTSGGIYTDGYRTNTVTVNTGGTLKLKNFGYSATASLGQLRNQGASRLIHGGTIEVTDVTHLSENNFYVGNNGGTFRYNPVNTADTLTLGGNANSNIDISGTLDLRTDGNISVAEVIQGAGGLIKSGTQVLTLSGDSTYKGATNVNVGKLAINGDNSAATGAVTVASGATLAGNGTVGGATTIQSGGIHGPGNSPGVQTFSSDLTYSAGSIFSWDLATPTVGVRGTNFDGVNVGGGLTIAPGAIFQIVLGTPGSESDDFWKTSQTWAGIFDVTGTKTGFFQEFQVVNSSFTSAPIVQLGSFSYDNSVGSLTWTAVPEPTSALAGLLIAAGLLRRRRCA